MSVFKTKILKYRYYRKQKKKTFKHFGVSVIFNNFVCNTRLYIIGRHIV